MSNKKFFYGWVVVAALCLLCAGPKILCYNYWSFYQVPVCTELGCTYVEFSFASTAATIAGMVFSMFFASKFAQGNTKLYMIILGIGNGIAWILIGFCQSIWPIVALYFVSGFCAVGCFSMAVNIIIPNWFIDRKGTAISFSFMGQGIGGAILSPVIASMIASMGWRDSIITCGIIAAVLYALIAGLFIKKTPQEKGLEPYRSVKPAKEKGEKENAAPAVMWEGIAKKEALKTLPFWLAMGTVVLCGFISAGVMTQLPTYMIELGVDYAPVMSVYSLALIAGMLLMGPLYDKIGIAKGILTCCVLLVGSFVLILMTTQNVAFTYCGVVLFALGGVVGNLLPPLLVNTVFGQKEYAGIYGLANTFFMAGCMIGPLLASGIRTGLGTYNYAWMAFIVISVLVFLLSFLAITTGKRLRENPAEK